MKLAMQGDFSMLVVACAIVNRIVLTMSWRVLWKCCIILVAQTRWNTQLNDQMSSFTV